MARGRRPGYLASRNSTRSRGTLRGSYSFSRSLRSRNRFSSSTSERFRNNFSSSERFRNNSRGTPRRSAYCVFEESIINNSRDDIRSPERKRMKPEAPYSQRSHGDDGGFDGNNFGSSSGRYKSSLQHSCFEDRRSYSSERRDEFRSRDDFRKPVDSLYNYSRTNHQDAAINKTTRFHSELNTPRNTHLPVRDRIRKRGSMLRSSSDFLRDSRSRIDLIRSTASPPSLAKSESIEKSLTKEEKSYNNSNSRGYERKGEFDKVETQKKDQVYLVKCTANEKQKGHSDNEGSKLINDNEGYSRQDKSSFIKLVCVHCKMNCVTFREYSQHLFSDKHRNIMRRLATQKRIIIRRMRKEQRSAQRDIEKIDTNLVARTQFCNVCKLNYRQLRAIHQTSEAHEKIRKFLMPYCRVCHITCKTPMSYENHICSLDHIKRKAKKEVINKEKQMSEEHDSPSIEDLENLMTLDSIGDVDDERDSDQRDSDDSDQGSVVGEEYVEKTKALYCYLCCSFLPFSTDLNESLKMHCREEYHLKCYFQHMKSKNAGDIEKCMIESAKESDADIKTQKTEASTTKLSELTGLCSYDDIDLNLDDDKLWEDVEKDIGDILAGCEISSNSSDDDCRSGSSRYNRLHEEKDSRKDKDAGIKKTANENQIKSH